MAWQDAVQPQDQGVLLLLEVRPGAQAAAFPAGFNPWRGRIGIRVASPPQGGRANKEVCAVVARFFDVPTAAVTLRAGAASTQKTIEVTGRSRQEAVERLEGAW